MLCMKHFRFLAMATLVALAVALAASLPGVSADGGVDKNRETAQGQEQEAPPIPEKAGLSYPSLGSRLDQLVASVEAGQTTAQDAASNSPVHSGGSVAVTIYLSGNVDEVVSFLEDNGGDPRNVGEDYIEAYVPVTLLGTVSEQPGVIRVREIVPPQPVQTFQSIIGHGPAVHGSPAWNQAGYSGQGVKVGVIDVGFAGLTSLMGTELPATVHARCYTDVGEYTENLADCEAPEPVPDSTIPECRDAVQPEAIDHGTIVAESVLDIAPGVELYISQPDSQADLQDASEWMASQGVSVINYSVGWFFDGPGDGTSPSSVSPLKTVDQSVESGVIWVNSAGNSGQRAWFSDYSDPDGDGPISFGGQNDEVMDLPVRTCRTYWVQLRWEDTWEGASTDLNLYLYDKSTGGIFEFSEDEQSGESDHVPFEWFSYQLPFDSNAFGLVVVHHSGDAPDWIQVSVWGTYIEHYTRNGSIGNPAESANPGMLAVGAAPWNNVHTIEPFSSRGPTPDGRGEARHSRGRLRCDGAKPPERIQPRILRHQPGVAPRCGYGRACASAVPRLHPGRGRQLPEKQRGAEAESGSQQHLGAWVRRTSAAGRDGSASDSSPVPCRRPEPGGGLQHAGRRFQPGAARHLVRWRDDVGNGHPFREPEDLRLRYGHQGAGLRQGFRYPTSRRKHFAVRHMVRWRDNVGFRQS